MEEKPNVLPVFDNIPDFIYAQTPVPESIQQAQQYCSAYKAEVVNLKLQLANNQQENSHWFNGDLTAWKQWRYKTHQALRIKNSQLFLIRAWLQEHRVDSLPNEALKQRLETQKQRQEVIESRLKVIAESGFTVGEFSQLRREVNFLRGAIGEISDRIVSIAAGDSIDLEELQRLADALNMRDRQLKPIASKLSKNL